MNLEPNDQILLFTDGVYEAMSPDGELYGVERLGKLFQEWASKLEGEALLNRLEQEILSHTGGVYTDDTTLLIIKYSP
jgi:serine phosphatase RsbU (regulator of sigma subunit)